MDSLEFRSAWDGNPQPVTAVIAAHPDDEAIGLGARLSRLRHAWFIHATDGAPIDGRDAARLGFGSRGEYAAARRRELETAFGLAGILPSRAITLDCIDQQTSLRLPEIVCRIAALITELEIGHVITHPYEGGHPDHDAAAFAVHAAARLLRRQDLPAPRLTEMTSYHNGPNGIETSTFLPVSWPHRGGGDAVTFELSQSERTFKAKLLDQFVTQRDVLKWFPIGIERFRPAPEYDFSVPPHAGRLYYEQFNWGMTGERFRELCGQALRDLQIEAPV